MKRNYLISVILPIYNVEAYLPRCLDSIINNSYKNLQIICVNDGSPDGCLEILKEYEKRDNRIQIIDKPNGGASSARNCGLDIAKGDFVAFIDPDDYIHKIYFEALLYFYEKFGADIVTCAHNEVSGLVDDACVETEHMQGNCTLLSQGNVFSKMKSRIWARIYKKDILADIRFEKMRLGEDVVFNTDVYLQNSELKIAVVEEPLYYYFKTREDSQVHTVNPNEHIKFVDYFTDKLKKIDFETESFHKIKFYTISAIKGALAARYLNMFSEDKKEIDKRLNKNFVYCLDCLKRVKTSPVEKIKYIFLWKFPCVYRAIRILGDKSLLEYEKRAKAQRKNSKV